MDERKILRVPDMHCRKCVERISNALSAAEISFDINLEGKTVGVGIDDVAKTIEELDDLGFEVEK